MASKKGPPGHVWVLFDDTGLAVTVAGTTAHAKELLEWFQDPERVRTIKYILADAPAPRRRKR